MSCEDCEFEQEMRPEKVYYFRIGNGNVEVRCCAKHAKELQDIIRRGIDAGRKEV